MIFVSHFYTMVIFTFIISVLLAFIKFDSRRDIFRYFLKLFIYMNCGVIVFSWLMHFL